MSLKPWFLIKSGNYIVPSPSTALTISLKNKYYSDSGGNNNNNQPGGINSDRPSLIDILNGAGFDGRNASPEIIKRGGGCGKGQVNR